MRVEQHLMGLEPVGTDHEGSTVAELAVRGLQLDARPADRGMILAPVELEDFARREELAFDGCLERVPPALASRSHGSRRYENMPLRETHGGNSTRRGHEGMLSEDHRSLES